MRSPMTFVRPVAPGRSLMGEKLPRRTWPIIFSLVFFVLGNLYFFRWGPVVQHVPSSWLSADDLWST
ncbi:MAG TPA: hypothetical protein VID75_09955, partial [Acidimicrobiales bacterium]